MVFACFVRPIWSENKDLQNLNLIQDDVCNIPFFLKNNELVRVINRISILIPLGKQIKHNEEEKQFHFF